MRQLFIPRLRRPVLIFGSIPERSLFPSPPDGFAWSNHRLRQSLRRRPAGEGWGEGLLLLTIIGGVIVV